MCGPAANAFTQAIALYNMHASSFHRPGATNPAPPHHAQSYGIKVGYGAGGPNPSTIKPGESERPAASSSCC